MVNFITHYCVSQLVTISTCSRGETPDKYVLDLLPGRSEESATICDYSFSLTFSANVDPAHLTVRFDNVYLVNQIMFDGYLPDVCKSPGDADRDNSPICYKVREFYA